VAATDGWELLCHGCETKLITTKAAGLRNIVISKVNARHRVVTFSLDLVSLSATIYYAVPVPIPVKGDVQLRDAVSAFKCHLFITYTVLEAIQIVSIVLVTYCT
jgi:hypothetical protein